MIHPPVPGLNRESLLLRVSAQERWLEVEGRLRAQQLTLGWVPPLASPSLPDLDTSPTKPPETDVLSVHEPEAVSSLTGVTIGQLLASRGWGLRSTLYGEVAATCVAVEGALSSGQAVASKIVPRSAAGPDWKHLLLGGGGQHGRLEAATLRVFPLPEKVVPLAYDWPGPGPAVAVLADLIHRGAIPAVAVVVPEGSGVRLLLTFEGQAELSVARARTAARLCLGAGGVPAGAEVVRGWLLEAEGEADIPVLRWPVLQSPTLRADAPWSVLAEAWATVQAYPGARFGVAAARHAAAALFVRLPEGAVLDREALRKDLAGLGASLEGGLEMRSLEPVEPGMASGLAPVFARRDP